MKIDGRTGLLGLMGNPVEHTLSPVIHNTLSEILHKNLVYVPFHVENGNVADAVRGAYALNIQGMNVTVPHKERVMESLVSVDPVAEAIQAVNTLVRVPGGFCGYNTDMPGLLRAIQSEGVELAGKTVLILGAGGASKAVAYMCMQERAEKIYMLNRTVEKAQEIADSMNRIFQEERMHAMALDAWKEIPEESWIVFQCTSVGLSPNVDAVVLEDREFYQRVTVGIDLIYNPAQTKFMRLVYEAGGRAFNGLKMLLYQGIIAYELWNDLAVTDEQAEIVYDRLYEAIHPSGDNIVLIGFMGSGKTTIGHELERGYGYSFLDTDVYIEKREGCSISDIFEKYGEAYFRKLETEVLNELIRTMTHTVISTGGGMPLRRENARLLRELGQVVYLKTGEEEIWDRLKGCTDRPLLNCDDPKGRVHTLLGERNSRYTGTAHSVINTDGKAPEDIAEEIHRLTEKERQVQ